MKFLDKISRNSTLVVQRINEKYTPVPSAGVTGQAGQAD
jgi:hypothetical protein